MRTTSQAPDLDLLRGVDIYLLDQILRRRVRRGLRVLDVGCGRGRNLPPLLALDARVTAIDLDPAAIACTREAAETATGSLDTRVLGAEDLPLDSAGFDLVLANAVLHFAPDAAAWNRWADGCWQSVKPGGFLLARLSTRIALPPGVHPPDFGYLATEGDLEACERRWGAVRLDPLKTTLVERLRTMTTWVVGAPGVERSA